jgi:hypothetical protein
MATKKRPPKSSLTMAAGEGTGTRIVQYNTQKAQEKPAHTSIIPVFERCRYWARESSFLRIYYPLRRSVFNFGFRLKAAPTGKKKRADAGTKLREWLAEESAAVVESYVDPQTQETITVESQVTNWERICKFVDDVWWDWFLHDNVVVMWTDNREWAWTLDLLRCEYTDTLGLERISYTHGLGQRETALLSPEDQERFKKARIILNVANGERFKVLKRSAMGDGFGVPGLYSLFRVLGEVESKEENQHALAWAARSVKRYHKLGHDIKGGPKAGMSDHFWKKEKSDAVLKQHVNKVGFEEITVNFDYDQRFFLPDPKLFDEMIWRGSDRRILQWAGPIGTMMTASGVKPYLTQLLKAEALDERERMARFLEPVIVKAFEPPVEVKLCWSNLIFNDARLHAELMKWSQGAGLASVRTSRQEVGLLHDDENEQKLEEAQDAEARKKYAPMFDSSHGTMPAIETPAAAKAKGQEPLKQGGKPPGATDGDKE